MNSSSNFNYIVAFTVANDVVDMKKAFSKDFENFSIVKGKLYTFITGVKHSHGIIPSITANGGIPIFPTYADGGIETFNVLLFTKESLDYIIDAVKSHNDVVTMDYLRIRDGDSIIDNIKSLFSNVLVTDLTPLEKKIIRAAFTSGFYTWPRQFSLEDISRDTGLSKPTVLYHIRNAERKVMRSLFSK
ncbi:hypothetical protein GCM10007108_13420 [Thermogymnomonas acidicola]|uniref:HTH bat-type domain-containing protein n=1 Tax=Thermogymnomonas acidicola TaxID=399579 RepID=A0AA37BSH2_9ARCH|nr:hypothetical protein GCM10007108_13420 [Thermogymnomonas acidicola]